ncbi:MAG: hypothetical protein AAB874_00140 [Patescibacteria group bacterium]
MCVIVPLKVTEVSGNFVRLEDGRCVKTGDVEVKTGYYVEVYADLVLNKISQNDALARRQLLKNIS